MRKYTDSADAIKAYMETVNFDFNKAYVTELEESEVSRGGLRIVIDNYYNKPMSITIHHTWSDLFDVTFDSVEKGEDTLKDIYADDLIGMFKGIQLAMTGMSREQWNREVRDL
jgi:hypothetical protein